MTNLVCGDARSLPVNGRSVHCCVTSPPYWGLRDYGLGDSGIGLESTPEEWVDNMVAVFREVWRVLRDDGTLWVNIGDSYAHSGACGGSSPDGPRKPRATDRAAQEKMGYRVPDGLKPKDLIGMPWRLAFALQADGWYLRSDIIWAKPNPMPESVTDRPTKSHEYVFLLSKSRTYYYDHEAIKEPSVYPRDNRKARSVPGQKRLPTDIVAGVRPGSKTYPARNKRDVWTVATQPYSGAHFATFPTKLIEPMIKAGCPHGGIVLDPFVGSGTTILVANELGRHCIGVDMSMDYLQLARKRVGIDYESLPIFATPES